MLQPADDLVTTINLLTGDDWAPAIRDLVLSARESILLSMFLFSHHWRKPGRPHFDLLEAFQRPARSGIECRAVFATVQQTLTREPPNIGTAEALEAAGWKTRFAPKARVLHEKYVIVDNRVVAIGSHNISRASASSNYEVSVIIENADFARKLRAVWWSRWNMSKDYTSKAEIYGKSPESERAALTGGAILNAASQFEPSTKRFLRRFGK